ncbi:cysteine desulfurase family protein [Hyphomicrobium sp. CS1BSMeth3]|uniref:cysteine desulfurase family protein n=1 Tax=Hyphomicrobium sp. CS1BSMeth3 TaxID=1892844 RepID=UPI000930E811|nr:cysteine desulfurase family protein [Hyphomicrobium sp. CS1BSMeth3]
MPRIYLDYNASTPICQSARMAMAPYLEEAYGNPSSLHWAGQPARAGVEKARAEVAALLGASADEIIFTSGGSEANNLALKGVAFALREKGRHIITAAAEHPAILAPCAFLEKIGFEVTRVPVDGQCRVDPDAIARAMKPGTVLVSIMHANNEVGTINPIADIARVARRRGALMHTDAAQSVGKVETKVDALGVDLLTMAGHKFGAPKGVGALYVRRGTPLEPLIHGAGHEQGRRAGTESALLAVALGAAARDAADLAPLPQVKALRDRLWASLRAQFGNRIALNGHPEERLPNTANISFVGKVGADILSALDGVAASTGSACHSGHVELSPVLAAMQVPPEVGMGAIRFSLGRATTEAEIDAVAADLVRIMRDEMS